MALYRVEALVLRSRNLGEADRVLTLLTRSEGKVRAVARGSRRPRNRLAGAVEPLSYGRYLLMSGRELESVQQAELMGHGLRTLREDLPRMAAASVTAELVDLLVEEGEPSEPLFALTLQAWTALARAPVERLDALVWWFVMGLMGLLGYAPQVQRCTACGQVVEGAARARFSAREGGLLCERCQSRDPGAPFIGGEARAILRRLQGSDAASAMRVASSAAASAQIDESLRAFVEYRLSTPPRAWTMWREIAGGQQGSLKGSVGVHGG